MPEYSDSGALNRLAALAGGEGRNATLTTGSAVFPNSAAAGSEQAVDFALPTVLTPEGKYLVTVYNPSAVTALTVTPAVRETLAGAERVGRMPTFAVPAGRTASRVVELGGEGGRVIVSNDTALGLADGFTATVRVRQL